MNGSFHVSRFEPLDAKTCVLQQFGHRTIEVTTAAETLPHGREPMPPTGEI